MREDDCAHFRQLREDFRRLFTESDCQQLQELDDLFAHLKPAARILQEFFASCMSVIYFGRLLRLTPLDKMELGTRASPAQVRHWSPANPVRLGDNSAAGRLP